jgi:hypothetical protein
VTAGLVARYAPPFRLVGAHFAAGIAGLLVFAAALLASARGLEGHFFQARVLALTHLCVLGWLMPITLGALHQLVPVVFERPLLSARLPYLGLACLVAGAAGMIWQFWHWGVYQESFVWYAGLAAAGLAIDVLHLSATIARSRRHGLTGANVLASFAWLLAAAILGVVLAWNLWHPFLAADHLQLLRVHAHAAALGFFGLLIMGVAYRLLEMFLLAYVDAWRPGWIALALTNAALGLLVASFLLGSRLFHLAAIGAGAVGIAAFLVQIRRMVRARARRALDPAFRHTQMSLLYLVLAALTGAALVLVPMSAGVRDRLVLVYGVLALPGFIGSIVIGQLHKILPFLVWFHRFGPYVGLKKVPTAGELLPAPPQRLLLLLLHGAIALLVAGVLADAAPLRLAGSALFAAAALVLTYNLGVIATRRP